MIALHDHRIRMQAEGHYRPDGLVFVDAEGGPIRKSNLRRRSFERLLQRAGLLLIRFHDLRHTAATMRLLNGDHPKVVQELLGHTMISMTMDTYSHMLPSMQKESAARLDRLLQKARS